jgi:hypothetical protein
MSEKSMRSVHAVVGEYSCVRRERFHSEARMRYDCQPNLRYAREEAMQW